MRRMLYYHLYTGDQRTDNIGREYWLDGNLVASTLMPDTEDWRLTGCRFTGSSKRVYQKQNRMTVAQMIEQGNGGQKMLKIRDLETGEIRVVESRRGRRPVTWEILEEFQKA